MLALRKDFFKKHQTLAAGSCNPSQVCPHGHGLLKDLSEQGPASSETLVILKEPLEGLVLESIRNVGLSHTLHSLTMILPCPFIPQPQRLALLTIRTRHWSPKGRVHTDHDQEYPVGHWGAWRSWSPHTAAEGLPGAGPPGRQ